MEGRRQDGLPVVACIGLGSNLDDPVEQVQHGLRALSELPLTRLVAVSSLYRSAPVGYSGQPDFVNAVAVIETGLAARELLGHLLAIERSRGRVRDFPNAPRTLDLDIVLYGEAIVSEPGLTIPHPRMHERAFVVVPLVEVAPQAPVPGFGVARDLLRQVDAAQVHRLEHAGS